MKKLFLFCIVIPLLLGCATSKFVATGNIYPPYTGPVKVYQSAPENVEYEEIGIVSSSGGVIHEWTHLIEAIQREAASKGANAVIIIKEDKSRIGTMSYNQFGLYGGTAEQKSLTAIAIRIK